MEQVDLLTGDEGDNIFEAVAEFQYHDHGVPYMTRVNLEYSWVRHCPPVPRGYWGHVIPPHECGPLINVCDFVRMEREDNLKEERMKEWEAEQEEFAEQNVFNTGILTKIDGKWVDAWGEEHM